MYIKQIIDKFIDMIKLLITGYCILLAAIIANIIAESLNIDTWYKFLQEILKTDFLTTIKQVNILSFLWLFIFYPIILSFGYLIGNKLYLLIATSQ
tara:strand:- start:301 stop:588 length:288 start_codon:yes stop_codon:yes gene_type:complete